MNIKRFSIAGLSVIIFVVALRGIIELLHPKEGGLIWIAESLFNESTMYWVVINISSPSYNFLIKNVWANPLVFWILVAAILVSALLLSKPKQLNG